MSLPNFESSKTRLLALQFLSSHQQKDGSFLSLSSADPHNFTNAKTYTTTFNSAFILANVASLKLSDSQSLRLQKKICQKLVKFLLKNKSDDWTWNYWSRLSAEASQMPYPDDLDDTFVSLTALAAFDPKLISGQAIAKVAAVLTTTESAVGGPYRTWLVDPAADPQATWQDIDLAVNANIAHFLATQEVELPNLLELTETAITHHRYPSRYYPSHYSVLHFISNWYKGASTPKARDFIWKKYDSLHHSWHNPLDTSLSILTLLNWNESPEKLSPALTKLQAKQDSDGSWPVSAFCLDPSIDGIPHYAGSASLTTAFCLKTINLYEQKVALVTQQQQQKRITQKAAPVYAEITQAAKTRFQQLKPDLAHTSAAFLQKMLRADRDQQITLFPYFFSLGLEKSRRKLPNSLIKKLGEANLFGWIAYTIFDTFLDEEGHPNMVSVATVSHRQLTDIFTNLFPKDARRFTEFFHEVMDTLDSANAWEIAHARPVLIQNSLHFPKKIASLPKYDLGSTFLAHRSLGHALGPLAILHTLGHQPSSPAAKHCLNFAAHYLTARQLDDDAHDWESDLKRGHLTATNTQLLKDLSTKHHQSIEKIHFDEPTLQKLQHVFWQDSITTVCHHIHRHTRLARRALKQLQKQHVMADITLFDQILFKIDSSAHKALLERDKMLDFLASYGQKPADSVG